MEKNIRELKNDGKIDDIQVLRGVAITMVLICHFSFSSTILAIIPGHLTNSFYVGVELFFVISGFVVTRSLMRSGYKPGAFLIRRGFRLYPPIIVFLAFSGAINAIIRGTGKPAYAVENMCVPLLDFTREAAAILAGYLINLGTSVSYMNGAMWSLSVEFQFYAAAAVLALLAVLIRVSPQITGRVFLAAAIVVYAGCAYSRILLTVGARPEFGSYVLNYRFDYMTLGVLLAYVPDRAFHRLSRYGRLPSIILLLVPIVALALCRSPFSPRPAGPDYLDGIGMLFVGLCYAGLVALAVAGGVSAALPRLLARVLFLIGERSYTIYLLHLPCMVVAWVLIVAAHVAWTENAWSYAAAQVVFTLLVLLPVTEFVYRRIELRWIRLGKHAVDFWRRRHAPFAVAQEAPGGATGL